MKDRTSLVDNYTFFYIGRIPDLFDRILQQTMTLRFLVLLIGDEAGIWINHHERKVRTIYKQITRSTLKIHLVVNLSWKFMLQ